MKQFFTTIFIKILLPIMILLIIIIYWDPFKVYFSYDDYYTNNPITGNREDICLKLLNKSRNNISNFIIGNSRSQAYKTNYWCKKIHQPNNTTFHYDGSNFGLYRTSNAIKYLSKKYMIKNILLIVDTDFFSETQNSTGHLFIQPPELTNESKFFYYLTFLRASSNLKFIFSALIFNLHGVHYDFMEYQISNSKHSHKSINSTGDIWYSYDQEIKSDSLNYYSKLMRKGVFFERSTYPETSKPTIKTTQMKLLLDINTIIKKNNINLNIVISPLYNQLVFNQNDKLILTKLFGSKNVFDFSGKNNITNDISNYYESSHYKTYIANQIIDSIYSNSSK
jgi:hypothetical protein